jgi:hypothetical protein
MILVNRKFVRAVPEAWFLSTVEKDDVKIIKMFYDILVMVRYGLWYGTIPYQTMARYHMSHNIPYHTGSKKPGPSDFIFSLFDAPFTTVLVINNSMVPYTS